MRTWDRIDFIEEDTTTVSVTGSGGTLAVEISMANAQVKGFDRVKIYELVADSDSTDFDVEVYEDDDLTRINRIIQITDINTHTVQRFLGGAQYRDREITSVNALTTVPEFHVNLINNGSAATIRLRIRYLPWFAR